MNPHCHDAVQQERRRSIERYYRVHASIYDLTRWSFLLGREALARQVACSLDPARILEVGCGTGKNLLQLGEQFPQARLWGLDLSSDMLAVAQKKLQNLTPRLTLIQAAYDRPVGEGPAFDLVVFSYALSMFNPGWEEALDAARHDLAPAGAIAVVDFHDSGLGLFKRWMGLNHVRLDGHLLPGLQSRFPSHHAAIQPAYGGLWSYFRFIGRIS